MFIIPTLHFKQFDPLGKFRTYIGTVVDNEDPREIGRVKTTVTGLVEGSKSILPWMHQAGPIGLGSQTKHSWFSVPQIGTQVYIVFPSQSIYHGIYYARPIRYDQGRDPYYFSKSKNYPKRYGWTDPQGTRLAIDMVKREMSFTHTSGFKLHVDSQSNYSMDGKTLWLNSQKTPWEI